MEINRFRKVISSENIMRDYINIKTEHNCSLKYTIQNTNIV